jgi:SAM-dependent MidA family methyltransferase
MREDGLREMYVAVADGGSLTMREGPLSTPALNAYLMRLGVRLEPGWRVEVNLAAIDWVRSAARSLRRGVMVLVDYGHEAAHLYSASHSSGTLTAFSGHRARGAESAGQPAWLMDPGQQDITAHVDFTSVRQAAEAEGLDPIGFMDQTYFLMGIASAAGALSGLSHDQRRMFRTLIAPGGLGSTMKVSIMGRNVAGLSLSGCSWRQRVT